MGWLEIFDDLTNVKLPYVHIIYNNNLKYFHILSMSAPN